MSKKTFIVTVFLSAAILLGACSNVEVEPEAVTKTSIGVFRAVDNPPREFPVPPWIGPIPDVSSTDSGWLDGFLLSEQNLTGYDGYEALCSGTFYKKIRITWQNSSTDTTVASSVRRVSGKGELNSDIGPTQDIQQDEVYQLAVYPAGIISPPGPSIYSCEIFGLDFN